MLCLHIYKEVGKIGKEDVPLLAQGTTFIIPQSNYVYLEEQATLQENTVY
jgi:hypothetical protein